MKGATSTKDMSRKTIPCFESAQGKFNMETEIQRLSIHDWWAPVWKGLVFDKDGQHYRKIGCALWLLIYFILCADRRTGTLKRKVATISRETGVKVRTIRSWPGVLRDRGYIDIRSSGRCLIVGIKKWKTHPQRHFHDNQHHIRASGRVTEICQSRSSSKGQETFQPGENSAGSCVPNDITIKKDILKNDNDASSPVFQDGEDSLAIEICHTFKDQSNLPLYLSYVRKYPAEIIQKAFKEALKLPSNKVKKTRGALFNYLVQYYAGKQHNPQDHRH